MRAVCMLFVSAFVFLSACATFHQETPMQSGNFVQREVTVAGKSYGYQVFVPSQAAGGTHPPVILFLHGSGERGSDNARQITSGLGTYVQAHLQTFPAIVVFPQAPDDSEWMGTSVDVAFAALDAASREFGGDPKRTYLTGLSMGGYGVWELALKQPRRFAALVAICGALKPPSDERQLYVTDVANAADPYTAVAQRLRDVPIRIVHGALDDQVSPEDDRALAHAFKAVGARDAVYTELPDANHNAWDATYNNAAMWDWLFAQRLR